MWKVFLSKWNGCSLFLESSTTPTPDLELYTDAARTMGFGGYFLGKWFQGHWPPHILLNRELGISIEWQDLFPIFVACAIWHPLFKGKRLQFWCDNESVVSIINSGHPKAPLLWNWTESLFSYPWIIIFSYGPVMSLGFQVRLLMLSPTFRCSVSGPSHSMLTRFLVPSCLH